MLRHATPLANDAPNEPRPIVLLVPGAAPHRPAKRWPIEGYAALARALLDRGFAVRLIGGPAEIELGARIADEAPHVVNLIGRTSLFDIAALGAKASLAVGNDTGPMHLIAAAGAPTVALFSSDSDPALCAPRGQVAVLREAELRDLPVERVLGAALGLSTKKSPSADA
jgi:ADP-heptose:LPS heptosyltransferase